MTAPNIVNVATITGKTAGQLVGTNGTAIVSNPANSGKVLKINALYVSNVDGTNNAEIDAYLYGNEVVSGFQSSAVATANETLDISNESTSVYGVFIDPSGHNVYVNDSVSIWQYYAATAWDVSTATFVKTRTSFFASPNSNVRQMKFNNDGTKIFAGSYNSDAIVSLPLSTAWDVQTIGTTASTLDISNEFLNPQNFAFNSDGTKLYVAATGSATDTIYQYDLTTAFDVTTGSYANKSLTFTQDSWGGAMQVVDNDTKLFRFGESNDDVYIFTMSTAGDISTATYTESIAFDALSGTDTSGYRGMFIKPDGSKGYLSNYGDDLVKTFILGSTAFDQFHVAKTVSIPADATLDVISKPIYLEEGFSLRLKANLASDLEAVCSYEEIS